MFLQTCGHYAQTRGSTSILALWRRYIQPRPDLSVSLLSLLPNTDTDFDDAQTVPNKPGPEPGSEPTEGPSVDGSDAEPILDRYGRSAAHTHSSPPHTHTHPVMAEHDTDTDPTTKPGPNCSTQAFADRVYPEHDAALHGLNLTGPLRCLLNPHSRLHPHRLNNPDRETLLREVVSLARPAVLTHLIDDWPPVRRWSFDWLKETYGDLRVDIGAIPYAGIYGRSV